MNEDLKKKLKMLLIFIGLLLLILLVVFLLIYLKKPGLNNDQLGSGNNNNIDIKTPPTTADKQEEPEKNITKIEKTEKKEKNANDVAKIAASFAERFGTYSNQSDFSNMVDLRVFMSEAMKTWSDKYVADLKKTDQEVYYGITTKAVIQDVKEFDNETGTATVLVKTRRREATKTIANVSKIFNQDITVKLVKDGKDWKVDSVFWEKAE